MTDVQGSKLSVGDSVWVCLPNYHYLIQATVTKVTPKGATVEYLDPDYSPRVAARSSTVSRLSRQIVKIT